MSSFLGHSVAAITVYVATEALIQPVGVTKSIRLLQLDRLLWICWLIVIASIPDLDYVVEPWQSGNNQGLRITHSFLFSLIMPSLTIATLVAMKIRCQPLWRQGFQVILAGLSHIVLDLLVGVTPLPLLFPLVKIPIKLPFGVLPSAGKINLHNYYFYRNLLLEMGVLFPLLIMSGLLNIKEIFTAKDRPVRRLFGQFFLIVLILCLGYFIRQNLQLPR
ncbi:MAG: metal-dependent hydrolase [Cyanobacteria bacterium P01_A01_bin.40]